jgi:hypothetical protein
VANAEITGRLQLYMLTLSSTIVALALVAQVSGLGRAFVAFALVLLPIVYVLGVATCARVMQASTEWRICGQGMNRIRHYYLKVAPEMAPYFVMPATDDPLATLSAVGIRGRSWLQEFLTAPAMIAVINSIVAGVATALLARAAGPPGPLLPAVGGAAGFVTSLVILSAALQRAFRRDLEAYPVAFPPEPAGGRSPAGPGVQD